MQEDAMLRKFMTGRKTTCSRVTSVGLGHARVFLWGLSHENKLMFYNTLSLKADWTDSCAFNWEHVLARKKHNLKLQKLQGSFPNVLHIKYITFTFRNKTQHLLQKNKIKEGRRDYFLSSLHLSPRDLPQHLPHLGCVTRGWCSQIESMGSLAVWLLRR